MANTRKRLSPRMIAFLASAAVAILIAFLIYKEQISILYVLVTLSLVVLLLIVGFSDLEKVSLDGSKEGIDKF